MFRTLHRLVCAALLTLAALPPSPLGATEALHVNTGFVSDPGSAAARIDAVAVDNKGTFDFTQNVTSAPWDTSNTRFFTNSPFAIMQGSVGFRFDLAPSSSGGVRLPSTVFNNRVNASISSTGDNPNYVLINSGSIYNQGLLSVGANGLLQMTATNLNLFNGGMEVRALEPVGTSTDGQKQSFSPDVAIYDNFWALALAPLNFELNSLVSGGGTNITVTSPTIEGTTLLGPSSEQLNLVRPISSFIDFTNETVEITLTNQSLIPTNVVIPSSIIRQAVFVGGPEPDKLDTNFQFEVKWAQSSDPFNPSKAPIVKFSNSATNVIDPDQPTLTTVYFQDTLASEPNFLFFASNDKGTGTSRPANYEVSREEPPAWQQAQAARSGLTNGQFYYSQLSSNRAVTGISAGYQTTVDHIYNQIKNATGPAEPSPGFTNLPGRLVIHAQNADFAQTRIRCEGGTVIYASHVQSTTNAVVDCVNLSYFLSSTNGRLTVTNLVQDQCKRVLGDVSLYSLRYTNFVYIFNTNYSTSAPPANITRITNIAAVAYSLTMLDYSKLHSGTTVIAHDLQLNSPNMTFSDNAHIEDTLLLNGDSFTLYGTMTLTNAQPPGSLNNFGAINAPTLKNFTNFGTILVTNVANFGTDTLVPYENIYNLGTIGAYTLQFASSNFLSSKSLIASASLGIHTVSGYLTGTNIAARGDLQIWADSFKLQQCKLATAGPLRFNVTNALFDDGFTSTNNFSTTNGCNLMIKPAVGDLLGTALDSTALAFTVVTNYWAAEDRGPWPSGYSNNVALGKLALHASSSGVLVFSPVGAQNAMYVDLLDISAFGPNFTNHMQIDPGMTIYFASSKGLPEATLNGKLGGRLVWVSSYAGPYSGTNVLVNNGQTTITVNRALLTSTTIDSDADGLVNIFDPKPFDGVLIQNAAFTDTPFPGGLALTWKAAANTIYQIAFTTDLTMPLWQQVLSYTNTASVSGIITVLVDTNAPAGDLQRFYRVNYSP